MYVGNLAQEITKEHMVKTFPKCRRIDIGYAKKMKYTRYAFVNFKNVTDSIAAFKQTHSTEMYSKSLIVRFRRLHGTVGMPGESKPQNPPKNRNDEPSTSDDSIVNLDDYQMSNDTQYINEETITSIKTEPSDEDDIKPTIDALYESPFLPGPIDTVFRRHKPSIIKVKTEDDDDCVFISNDGISIKKERLDDIDNPRRKSVNRFISIVKKEEDYAYLSNDEDVNTEINTSILDHIKKEKVDPSEVKSEPRDKKLLHYDEQRSDDNYDYDDDDDIDAGKSLLYTTLHN